jgi:geranylgeranyl pyrophosphate synthase
MIPASTTSAARLDPGGPSSPVELVAGELQVVEHRILELLDSKEVLLTRVGHSLIASGGKRICPALVLLVFRAAGGADPADTIDVGAAIELIHSATLLHDDILDSGTVRRGRPSPYAQYGLTPTLVGGDFLFAKAFSVAGRFDAKVVGWAAEACVQLCEGEMLQNRYRRNPEVVLENYLTIAHCKTASLFRQSARIGAHFAKMDPAAVDTLAKFGDEIGVGFQMVDDLLDVLGPEETIGKPVGSDLREGAPALPTVLALASHAEVAEVFIKDNPSKTDVANALSALRQSDILDQVREMARSRIRSALACLDTLPESIYRGALEQVTRDLLDRTS